ncbi:hypothetical protein C8F04DRAFT_1185778 [Mycena alexandri]|uniref:FAD-binding domain-containing protein n=1 Tax=Mycena alexandri TaxID=1745969 RepID=A0AAD6X0T8_9AGAR|nr:hypothetical protein C8F04DRAFT_1185778 [Mycena alexandri]
MSQEVAIIGAGLSGLSFALALHQQSIPCTIYESRPDAPLNIGGAVMLSPNALRILDRLGVYDVMRTRGYNFTKLEYRNVASTSGPEDTGVVTETQEFGGAEKYQYDGLRIYRTQIIDTLLAVLAEKGISIRYGHKFTKVIEETAEGVTWEWADGTTGTAAVLVGADGIHSTVRKYLYPDLKTTFTGMAGITAAVPTAQLEAPADLHMPVTFILPGKGAFVIAPQGIDGSEILIGKQRRIGENDLTREEWATFISDKEGQAKFLQSDNEGFPDLVHRAAAKISHDRINVWPFYIVPKLDTWSSPKHQRVVILGDAAHAIPPSAGQGINQAFEDIYTLALLLGGAQRREKKDPALVQEALKFWQSHRQSRVDQVLELNKQIDLRRVPGGEDVERKEFDLAWLYTLDPDQVVQEWLDARR